MRSFFFSRKYPLVLLCILAVLAVLASIHVLHPEEFPFEIVPMIVLILLLVFTARRFPFSNLSYTLIFLYLCLHTLASHYTYSNVPYNTWFIDYFHFDLNHWLGTTRNMYDRLVHFSFGLLLAYPAREIFMRIGNVRGFWSFYFPLDMVMALSMLYELIEWAIAVFYVGTGMDQLYIGMQGDIWDAQKDMFADTLGAIVATAYFFWNYGYARIRHTLRHTPA